MDTNTPFRIAASLANLRRITIGLTFRVVLGCVVAMLAACSMAPVEPPPVSGLPRTIGATFKGAAYSRGIQLEPDTFALQTGSRVFSRAGSPDVDLVGVMHVAEKDYYSRIQARLGRADVVLYEGVGGSADGDGEGGNPTFERLASSLGLVVQRIDYSPKSFRWCDLTWQEMKGRLESEVKQGGPDAEAARKGLKEFNDLGKLLDGDSWNVNMVLGLVRMSSYLKAYCKLLVVGMNDDAGEDDGMSRRLRKLIEEDRNAHVVAELQKLMKREPGHRRIAIFYGADHMPDLERRLRAMGYRPKEPMSWEAGVYAHPYAAGISEEEVKAILEE